MKNFVTALVSVLCVWGSVLYVGASNNRVQLIQLEADILRDQIADMSFQNAQLLARKTYEDGVADGFANANSVEYTKGYHAATEQFATQTANNLLTTK